MKNTTYISTVCQIVNGSVYIDGKLDYTCVSEDDVSEIFKEIYRQYAINYPKFFKMDNLCKLALLSTEILIRNSKKLDSKTAVVLSNNAASLDIDRKHQATINNIENYYPSPANFVYTLPNIAIGEISIMHQLQSENAFFVFDVFNSEFLSNYATTLLATTNTNAVICGWVEIDGINYNGFVYLVKKGSKNTKNSDITQLFKTSD
ncbi:MAG: 3-oxoacyl-ACP synthase [Flavobacteriales bacterium]|nr:MAG: 3-oxoacyl-ACP synthase [Flavobacteriales bacterium]